MKHILAVLLCTLCGVTFADSPAPNVVYIMADDLGWGDISAHGGGVATPNIDRLFRQYATDWVEFDIAFSFNTPKRDPFYSPMRGNDSKPASLLLRKGVGIDQHGREQANGPGPRDPASPWEHRIIGLCANAPGL